MIKTQTIDELMAALETFENEIARKLKALPGDHLFECDFPPMAVLLADSDQTASFPSHISNL
jgi:hypothetical protein